MLVPVVLINGTGMYSADKDDGENTGVYRRKVNRRELRSADGGIMELSYTDGWHCRRDTKQGARAMHVPVYGPLRLMKVRTHVPCCPLMG